MRAGVRTSRPVAGGMLLLGAVGRLQFEGDAHRVTVDAVDVPCVLLEYAGELCAMQENGPKIRFHALREHAGLVFQRQLEG